MAGVTVVTSNSKPSKQSVSPPTPRSLRFLTVPSSVPSGRRASPPHSGASPRILSWPTTSTSSRSGPSSSAGSSRLSSSGHTGFPESFSRHGSVCLGSEPAPSTEKRTYGSLAWPLTREAGTLKPMTRLSVSCRGRAGRSAKAKLRENEPPSPACSSSRSSTLPRSTSASLTSFEPRSTPSAPASAASPPSPPVLSQTLTRSSGGRTEPAASKSSSSSPHEVGKPIIFWVLERALVRADGCDRPSSSVTVT